MASDLAFMDFALLIIGDNADFQPHKSRAAIFQFTFRHDAVERVAFGKAFTDPSMLCRDKAHVVAIVPQRYGKRVVRIIWLRDQIKDRARLQPSAIPSSIESIRCGISQACNEARIRALLLRPPKP